MGDDILEGEEFADDMADTGGMAGAEFVAEAPGKPKADVYTLILILTFVFFVAGIIIAGKELYEAYDVQFWVFTKE